MIVYPVWGDGIGTRMAHDLNTSCTMLQTCKGDAGSDN